MSVSDNSENFCYNLKRYKDVIDSTDMILRCNLNIPMKNEFKHALFNQLYSHYSFVSNFHRLKIRDTIEEYMKTRKSVTDLFRMGKFVLETQTMHIERLKDLLHQCQSETSTQNVFQPKRIPNPTESTATFGIDALETFKMPVPVAMAKNMNISISSWQEPKTTGKSKELKQLTEDINENQSDNPINASSSNLDASFKSVDDSNYDYFKNYEFKNDTIQFMNPADSDFTAQTRHETSPRNQSIDDSQEFIGHLRRLSVKFTSADKENLRPSLDFIPDRNQECLDFEGKSLPKPSSFDNLDQTVLDSALDLNRSPRILDPSDFTFLY